MFRFPCPVGKTGAPAGAKCCSPARDMETSQPKRVCREREGEKNKKTKQKNKTLILPGTGAKGSSFAFGRKGNWARRKWRHWASCHQALGDTPLLGFAQGSRFTLPVWGCLGRGGVVHCWFQQKKQKSTPTSIQTRRIDKR